MTSVNGKAAARRIAQIITAQEVEEGEGFLVKRPFPTASLDHVDPFLLLDHFGPTDFGPGQAKGAPDHPHRGFETVTYLLDGEMEHKDSEGHAGSLKAGDVQWMTAGSGVIHSEMPSAEFRKRGGRLNGFQLWVNLPASDKMIEPQYQELPADRIPVVRGEDGRTTIRVIAGEAFGVQGGVTPRSPARYLHATLEPGATWSLPTATGHTAVVYVISGNGEFGAEAKPAVNSQLVVFDPASGDIVMKAVTRLDVLVLTAQPLREPVARFGPFVMNTQAEIRQAITDFRAGRMGRIS